MIQKMCLILKPPRTWTIDNLIRKDRSFEITSEVQKCHRSILLLSAVLGSGFEKITKPFFLSTVTYRFCQARRTRRTKKGFVIFSKPDHKTADRDC